MAERTSIKFRNRAHVIPMTAEDSAKQAAELFARASRMPHGDARDAIVKKACDFRMLAEMKRVMATPRRT